MHTDFSQPQRQSIAGILIMFLDTARSIVAALWPILIIAILRSDSTRLAFTGIFLAILIVITGVVAWLRYQNFTFHIDQTNTEFVLNEGIFNKSRTVIGLEKIQQVNISQSLLQQIIGVHAVEIDTAGSGGKEVKIKAVSHNLALALKARLLEPVPGKEFADGTQAETQSETPIIALSTLSLLKVGLTSNYFKTIGILLAFAISLWEQFRQVLDSEIVNPNKFNDYLDKEVSIASFLIIPAFLLTFVLIFNVVRTILRYYNYKITKQGHSLLLSYGLLGIKNTIIRPNRVQVTSVSQNYFQKKLNVLELRVRQAGMDTDENYNKKERGVDIPGCDARERDQILHLLYGQIPELGEMLRPNFRKLFISVFFTIVLPLGLFFTLGSVVAIVDYIAIAAIYFVIAAIANYFGFKQYRFYASNRFAVKQSGVWDITREIVEAGKIQSVSVSQLFWHRSLDIGTLTLHTAGGDVSFSLANFSRIKAWTNYWLYAIEKQNSNWM